MNSKILQKIFYYILIIVLFSAYIYSSLYNFYDFNLKYLEDLYIHSQWRIPISTRIISDDKVYQFAGYKLINQGKLFDINPEVPPVGKYIYGLSIKLFNNPFWSVYLLFIFSSIAFIYLNKLFFKKKYLKKASFLLLFSSPLFAYQIRSTMLDLPQLLWLILHIYMILLSIRFSNKKKYLLLTISGVFLGLFAATKLAAFLPAILVADFILLLINAGLLGFVYTTIISGIGYVLVFAQYFLQGHNFIAWLKAEKWTLDFYLKSKVEPYPLKIFLATLTGWYKDIWGHTSWSFIYEWSILWPIIILLILLLGLSYVQKNYKLILRFKFKKIFTQYQNNAAGMRLYLWIYISLFLIEYIFLIPSFSRYLILILPFGIILLVDYLQKHKFLLYLIIIIQIIQLSYNFFPTPQNSIDYLSNSWRAGNYAEVYNFLDSDFRKKNTREEFTSLLKKVDTELAISNTKLEFANIGSIYPWKNSLNSYVQIQYQTPLGMIINNQPVRFEKNYGFWVLKWDWQLVLPNYLNSKTKVVSDINFEKSADLYTKDGILLSSADYDNYLQIDTDKFTNWDYLIKKLNQDFDFSVANLEYDFLIKGEGRKLIFIKLPKLPSNSDKIMNLISKNPGISVVKRQNSERIYSSILSSEEIKKVQVVEKTHPELFGDYWGQIKVGDKLLISKPKDFEDVTLDLSFYQIFGHSL